MTRLALLFCLCTAPAACLKLAPAKVGTDRTPRVGGGMLAAAVASAVFTFAPSNALATLDAVHLPATFTVADTQSVEERRAARKLQEAADAEVKAAKKAERDAARAAKEAEKATKLAEERTIDAVDTMTYKEREALNKNVLFITSAVVLLAPIAGIRSAQEAISRVKGDMDLNARDNTRNF